MNYDNAEKIIVTQDWGGLGDNLQYSTLPEMFAKKRGHNCVWISNKNAHRFDGIKQLVWDMNPYVAGFTDEKANAGTAMGGYQNLCDNHIKGVEMQHGLEPKNDFPKIYYDFTAVPRDDFAGSIFIDMTASSSNPQIGNKNIAKKLQKWLDEVALPSGRNIFVVKHKGNFKTYPYLTFTPIRADYDNQLPKNFGKKHPDWNVPSKRNRYLKNTRKLFEEYEVRDIYHYACLLKHCHTFVCLFSGGNALASAIKQKSSEPHIVCFVNSCYIHEWNFAYIYKNVKYMEC